MTSAVAKYAARKMLSKEMDKYKTKSKGVESQYDPYYEMIEHPTKPGKMKKVKKQIPAYIPEHDANVLARARKTAYRLDFALFSFAGIRFGWSSVIGLIPAVGDAADLAMSANLVRKMYKVEGGLPAGVLFMMFFNMALDFLVGLVPFVGDLVDAAVKCNGRNVRLFEQHLDKKYKPKKVLEMEEAMVKQGKRRPRPASVYLDLSDEEEERRNTFDDRHDDVHQPQRAYTGRRERPVDEEMGLPRNDRSARREERPVRNNSRRY